MDYSLTFLRTRLWIYQWWSVYSTTSIPLFAQIICFINKEQLIKKSLDSQGAIDFNRLLSALAYLNQATGEVFMKFPKMVEWHFIKIGHFYIKFGNKNQKGKSVVYARLFRENANQLQFVQQVIL